jgi:peptidoglycan hydrolase-like protein with peptidoglycan-binding domain
VFAGQSFGICEVGNMFAKNISVALVSASLIAVPVQRAQASDAAAILGGLIVGGIIVNEVNKNNKKKRAAQQPRTTQKSSTSSSQRAQNRQVQGALNYFGYNVGAVDGSIGRNTRNGIARYQSDMGFYADGSMDPYERDFLISSQQRAEASVNVAPYNTILATQGRGGLLRTFRDEQLGIAPATAAVAPAPAPVPAPVLAPKTVSTKAETATLPEFNFTQSSKSISTLCNEINVLTAANGGVTSASRIEDAEFSLNEQFCLARTHAMAEAATIEVTIPNSSSAQIKAQCVGLSQAIAPHIASLNTARPDAVINATSDFMQSSGQPIDRLISGGKVCLGVGYRTDDADMALASAVLLASGGELGYGEVVSHQMREGFASTPTSPQMAGEWMTLALTAMVGGSSMVLGQSADRVAVLKAAMESNGQTGVAALPVFPSTSGD